MKIVLRCLAGIIVTAMTAWGVGVLYYSPLAPERWRAIAAGAYAAMTALAFVLLPRRGRTLAGFLIVFAVLVVLFLNIPASNDRDWQTEVSVTPYATVQGDLVRVHGVRNFDYRTETDFTPRWEDRTYDLRTLDSADVIAVYWAGKAVAHVMVSFGFQGKDYLAISIETRKEKGEEYSTLAGFFRQYELVYIVADERDVIRVRTTYRQPQEDVYIYRTRAPLRNIRRIFLDYIQTMNDMRERPRYYNTLTTNCTTGALFHTRVNPGSPPLTWKVFLSGHVPEYLYELGGLDRSMPFPELQRRSWVDERARAAGDAPDFSRRIREAIPLAATQP